MNFNNPQSINSTIARRAMCAIVFVSFTFCYLYFFQSNILKVAQHVLSDGQTHYDSFVGALLITVVLTLVAVGVYSITKLTGYMHALIYFPSFLFLAFITSVSSHVYRQMIYGGWPWVIPLVLVIYGLGVYAARRYQPYENIVRGSVFFSSAMWVNLLLMAGMMTAAGFVGNSNDVFHYRCNVESLLDEGKYGEATKVGDQSLVTDGSLTMLRIYSLSREGRLADELFHYPISGFGEVILPSEHSRCLLYPIDSIYLYLGAVPKQQPIQPMRYLHYLFAQHKATKAAGDYLLIKYLLDCNLDAFAKALPKFYAINASLPKHYREALTLYIHHRAHPILYFHDSALEADYADLQELRRKTPNPVAQLVQIRSNYSDTYWAYYLIHKRN